MANSFGIHSSLDSRVLLSMKVLNVRKILGLRPLNHDVIRTLRGPQSGASHQTDDSTKKKSAERLQCAFHKKNLCYMLQLSEATLEL